MIEHDEVVGKLKDDKLVGEVKDDKGAFDAAGVFDAEETPDDDEAPDDACDSDKAGLCVGISSKAVGRRGGTKVGIFVVA